MAICFCFPLVYPSIVAVSIMRLFASIIASGTINPRTEFIQSFIQEVLYCGEAISSSILQFMPVTMVTIRLDQNALIDKVVALESKVTSKEFHLYAVEVSMSHPVTKLVVKVVIHAKMFLAPCTQAWYVVLEQQLYSASQKKVYTFQDIVTHFPWNPINFATLRFCHCPQFTHPTHA